MKLVKCKDCGDSKEILIEINSFDQTFQCKVCYNEQHSTNYFLRKQEELNEKRQKRKDRQKNKTKQLAQILTQNLKK